MSENLKGYTALVTGGSSGLGYEMAKELLSRGATVVITARREDRLFRAEKSLKDMGYDVHALLMDVRDELSVEQVYQWFHGNFDHLDMLVNNAGIGANAPGMEDLPVGYKFYEIPVSSVKAVLETNLLGHFLVSSKFLPMMVERKKGSIVYVSTSTATITRPGQIPYGPSKAGAEAMSAIMAAELREYGIAVNIICPGGVTDTDMASEQMKRSFKENKVSLLPPSVLNRTIAFLASSASSGITGEKIVGKEFDQWLESRKIRF